MVDQWWSMLQDARVAELSEVVLKLLLVLKKERAGVRLSVGGGAKGQLNWSPRSSRWTWSGDRGLSDPRVDCGHDGCTIT